MRERIQKLLAARGVGSRRQVEAWIAEGRVSVNGKPATPGQPVGERDDIRLDGRRLRLGRGEDSAHRGVAYHRPAQEGVRAGARDTESSSLERLPKAGGRRWVPVNPLPPRDGGLEVFVTDGELAAALTRRSAAISSEYSVRVRGEFEGSQVEARIQAAAEAAALKGEIRSVAATGGEGSNRWLQISVLGVRPRDLREILAACGLEANRILRTRYGPIAMDRALARGRSRALTEGELTALREAAQGAAGNRSTRR
ncbi:MAG TPA: S4 domain-containing protein [Steroidobacteraceae bacterium]|nr:S4 domain-containing protein [Steroidobacteraceae bacterium]